MDFQGKLLPFVKEHGIALCLGVVGVVLLGYGFLNISQPQQSEQEAIQSSKDKISPLRTIISPKPKQITIDIEGSVEKPGVYAIPAQSRMQDALIKAGGMSQNADRPQIAKNLNLASPLMDGAKIYIPAVGEQFVTSGNTSDSSSGTVQGVGAKTVNINQASEEELDGLSGVGPVTAQKIISNRPYQSVEELLTKKVVGQSVYTKIKDQVSVY